VAFLLWLAPCNALAAHEGWVRVEGVSDTALVTQLVGASGLARMTDTSTFTDVWLLRKAEKETKELLEVLHAAGFHDASIVPDVRRENGLRFILFSVQTGSPYTFDTPQVTFTAAVTPATVEVLLAKLSVKAGDKARFQEIVNAEKGILALLRDSGHPFAQIADRDVLIDRSAQSVHVVYEVAPGSASVFGPVTVQGLEQVSESVVIAELPWKQGEPFKQKTLEKARRRLLKTNLFSMVDLEPQPSDTPGQAGIHIGVVERKPRSVALGLEYRTEEGPGVHAAWEHRNLRGIGHRLELKGDLSAIQQGFSAKYEMPRYRIPDQKLSLEFKAANDMPTAYDSRAVDTTLWLERQYGESFTAGAGLSVRYSRVRQQDSFEDFLLGSLPLQAVLDTRNDRLNPSSGIRTILRTEPYIGLAGSNALFLKSDWMLSGMHALSGGDDWVLAARLRLGSIAGENLQHVPADIRFYAGGGGSIRGFGYQMAGDLDCENDPVGGRSLAEWTVEIRKKITNRIGLAAFVDGGGAFSTSFPDLSQDIFWGGGMGLRYFTPIGPIRFDIAAPLNPRNHVDASLQFYVSVGQAF
jgi:translocation and assembly module TamA